MSAAKAFDILGNPAVKVVLALAAVAVRPELPPVPDNLAQPCRDPGVRDVQTVADATSAIADSRRFAACANRQHRDTIQFYEAVRDGLTGNPQ